MTQKIRAVVQWSFLGVFLALNLSNRGQVWMGIIFLSIALAAIFGRYYCGWMCPIHTLIRPTKWLSRRLGVAKEMIPPVLKAAPVRWLVLAAFLPVLGYTIYTITQGNKFPLPLFIIGLGLLTTFLLNERSWHRYLCPWGILFSGTAGFSKFRLAAADCRSCGTCAENCPAEAVTLAAREAAVTPRYCLLCLQCKTACPAQTVRYRRR